MYARVMGVASILGFFLFDFTAVSTAWHFLLINLGLYLLGILLR